MGGVCVYLPCATALLLVTAPCSVTAGSHRNGHGQPLFTQSAVEFSGVFHPVGVEGHVVPRTLHLLPAAVSSLSCYPRCGLSWAPQGCGSRLPGQHVPTDAPKGQMRVCHREPAGGTVCWLCDFGEPASSPRRRRKQAELCAF